MGRTLLKRLEAPRKSYEKRIVNNMANLYSVIQKGDVVLVEGRSEISRIIQVLTLSSWSHSAFYVGDALEACGVESVKKVLKEAGEPDRWHMLDGSALIMRHYSQIVPRDFDLSPNFEIIKYNIIGMGDFDYKSIWAHNGFLADQKGEFMKDKLGT